jgi:hypothetical protein
MPAAFARALSVLHSPCRWSSPPTAPRAAASKARCSTPGRASAASRCGASWSAATPPRSPPRCTSRSTTPSSLNDNDAELLATARFGARDHVLSQDQGRRRSRQGAARRAARARRRCRPRRACAATTCACVVDANCLVDARHGARASSTWFAANRASLPLVTALEQPFAARRALARRRRARVARRAPRALAAGVDVVADESCSTAADVQRAGAALHRRQHQA